MLWNRNRRFCDINPTCYAISMQKEICKRHLKNLLSNEKFAETKKMDRLPNVVSCHSSNMIKRAKGIDLELQENKAINIMLACGKINGLIVHPAEVFSFWKTVGVISEKNGYKEGRVIQNNKLIAGIGGGLCNLGNIINLLVLHSPLEVIEFHYHSDALAPDEGGRVPLSAGISVCYNYVDYRFKNTADQDVQLLLWCESEILHAELRSERAFPWRYKLVEENHHFKKEGNKFYRNSKIYKEVSDSSSANIIAKELVLDNHSEVMFDYNLIPEDQIRA